MNYFYSSSLGNAQALRQHRDAALEGQGEAHDAVLASLQCMQALTSGGGGMDAAIAAPDFVQCLCSVLDPDDQDCSKLVVEMLTKLCLYSVDGYCAAVQVCIATLPGFAVLWYNMVTCCSGLLFGWLGFWLACLLACFSALLSVCLPALVKSCAATATLVF